MAGNILQRGISPVKPKVLEQERIFVYVEEASDKIKGIASFDYYDFLVNKGHVKINWPYAHDDKFGLVQIDKDGYLEFKKDSRYLDVNVNKLKNLISLQITQHNLDSNAHVDIRTDITKAIEDLKASDFFTLQTVNSTGGFKYSVINSNNGILLNSYVKDFVTLDTGLEIKNDKTRLYNTGIGTRSIELSSSGIILSNDNNIFKVSPVGVTLNDDQIATETFVKNELQKVSSIRIRNIEPNLVIEADAFSLSEIATKYIIDNYNRQPEANDGLFITRIDLNDDVVKYAYFNGQWINIGVNGVDLASYVDVTSAQNISGNKNFTGGLHKNSKEVATVDDVKDARKLLVLGATGTIGEKATFVVEDAESYLEFRNNLTEFIFSGIIPVTGEIDLTKEVTIDFGDTSYYLFSAVDTSKRLTLGDLDFALRESLVTGYNYLFRTVFFENADQVGFAVLPDKEDVLSLDSDQMDNYIADGGLLQGQLAICKKVITNGYSEGGIYRFKITYPNTYEWEELSPNVKSLVNDINALLDRINGEVV